MADRDGLFTSKAAADLLSGTANKNVMLANITYPARFLLHLKVRVVYWGGGGACRSIELEWIKIPAMLSVADNAIFLIRIQTMLMLSQESPIVNYCFQS